MSTESPRSSACLEAAELQPLRGELFSIDHLRTYAIELAQSLTVVPAPLFDRRFFRRFQQNSDCLRTAYRTISQAIREGEPLTPDAEWLLDNFYVVEEHLHEIQDDLPPVYFRELPKLASGKPRILQLAEELIIHTDSVVQQDDLTAFINEFQSRAPLTIGELWALPIMLRLSLVENLRRLSGQMLANLTEREALRGWLRGWQPGTALPEQLTHDPVRPELIAHSFAVLGNLFPDDAGRTTALDQLLLEKFPAATELIRAEHRRQAANQVSIGNVITSMRLISALDWTSFFEQTSLVERMLRTDPSGVYPRMDAETRDRYRHAVEDLAKHSGHQELNVTDRVVAHAHSAPQRMMQAHVGYWLVDDGRPAVERELGYRAGVVKRIQRAMLAAPNVAYFGLIGAIGLTGLAAVAGIALATGLSGWMTIVLTLVAALPLTEITVSLVNWIVTHSLPPRILPKLDLSEGVPHEWRTFVVVPALLTGRKEISSLLERLEMHYVSNPEPELRFALLTDFTDSESERLETDAQVVEQAAAGIRQLNSTYGTAGRSPFYLFHRSRKWNECEQTWMGWERKRGKLMEFNRLLHGDRHTSYSVQEGDLSFLEHASDQPAFPFIITLDADTQLPLTIARRLIGTLAHPLNRAQLAAPENRVEHGYTILQPRVSVALRDGNRTRFTQLFANAKGIDPYAAAASDVYQDLFGEGSFTGKGIYDVRSFEQTLADAFGENQILSHDLIEGCHARVGLVSDIEVLDGYPARYDAEARRSHRWVRGDWQILPWLFSHVPCARGARPNRLSMLSRWKILDNLRRSLVAPALCLLLILSWFLPPPIAQIGTVLALLCVGWPIVSGLMNALPAFSRLKSWRSHLRTIGRDLLLAGSQSLVLAACLPHKSYLMLDAVVRTIARLAMTRRRMLEWETAAATERRLAKGRWSILWQMAFVPILALLTAAIIPPSARWIALPWLLLWFVSPLVAHLISQPMKLRQPQLSDVDKDWLRLVARRTWSYFETCVGPQTNWLPPDNLQEYPEEKLAERISPTNEGLFLVSALIARDMGFLGLHALADCWEKNLAVWRRLPQLRGHFYNWYETSTLQPLLPRYVSTVDSGNLAASLLVIRQAADELSLTPVLGDSTWTGWRDGLTLALHACDQLQPRGARMVSPPLDDLSALLGRLNEASRRSPKNWQERAEFLDTLRASRNELAEAISKFVESHRHPTREVEARIRSLSQWIDGFEADLLRLTPWIADYRKLQDALPGGQASEGWNRVQQTVESAQSLERLQCLPESVSADLAALLAELPAGYAAEIRQLLTSWQASLREGARAAVELQTRVQAIGSQAEQLALNMDFKFLFNPQRRLFSIGYNLEDGRLDRSYYDMLCSEARLSSHLAIAKGDVEFKHWFQLGRQATFTAGQPGLLSWGGTMFEFLMPLLFQRSFTDSLLTQACQAAVARQQEYGRQRGVPWGVSESAFAALAGNADYCYQSFGVPGLGLKRGLSDDLVIAPYATMLALTIAPTAAVANLRRLKADDALGIFGFYDAVDYTPARVSSGRRSLPVRCYMAHHHAMSLAAISNVLSDRLIERRFHAHPLVRATETLLQEAVPTEAPVLQPHADEAAVVMPVKPEAELVSRRMVGVVTPMPRTHLLSNGSCSVMVTNTGGGYSRRGELGVTRWRPDGVKDEGGHWIYIRDRRTGEVWSATYQPTRKDPDSYEVTYSIDKAEYRRRDGEIETHLEVTVSPDNDVELRQLKLTNHGWRPCELEITSYVEVMLATPAADLAHPAFQKLFIETEYVQEEATLLAKRRPRESHAAPLWALHTLACTEVPNQSVQFESSREKFLGRDRDSYSPAAMDDGVRLSGTTGLVLDPVFSLRCSVSVARNASVSLAFATGTAESRDEALRLADQFHEQRSVQRAFDLAWVFNQVQLQHLHLTAANAQRFQQLASFLLFPQSSARGPDLALQKNRQGQSGLWRFGISGDRPILLVNVAETEHVDFVRELLFAHEYWQYLGLMVDLVILNTHPGSYLDELQEQLQRSVQEVPRMSSETRNAVFLLRAAHMPREDQWLLESAASVALEARRGWSITRVPTPSAPINRAEAKSREPAPSKDAGLFSLRLSDPRKRQPAIAPNRNGDGAGLGAAALNDLEFWNGLGGFAAHGSEYHIRSKSTARTPAPWSNVIANPRFGTLVTEGGGGYSWAGNSRQNKLTTWSNDPVTDPAAEILYLRDDDQDETLLPMSSPQNPEPATGWVQHGQGYTRFRREWNDIEAEILVSIAPDDPVKFICLKLHNHGQMERRVTATYYADLVLGVCREHTQMHLVTEPDRETGALLCRNAWHPSNFNQTAFLRVLGPNVSITGDRAEFIGRNGRVRDPAALRRGALSGRTGAGLDPCGVVQSQFTILGGEKAEIIFLLGCGNDAVEANSLLRRYGDRTEVHAAIEQTISRWDEMLSSVQVRTPNRAFDLLVNRWLLYQVLSCRVWGRSAFYQAGGAYGFRDQLQDAMALVYSRPDLVREHLLRAAARQFEEGDVQHWWHPPLGEGTRTRFSDDLLWLPFVAAHYIQVTGDEAVLEESIPFLHSHPLAPEEQERYELPQVSGEHGSLYEHCLRTLAHGTKFGEHGLPLMGCGDWNDGMNLVGALGKGESVWVGWFLLVLLDQFIPLMERRDDHETAERYRRIADDLRTALETHGWDGKWYRRAFFDDGTPLGSQQNDECQIDSIVQSWAVFASADSSRTTQALDAVFERLVSREHQLVALFTPPFDRTELDPGYIKGYLPGVRENGGQYTHAVMWLIQALTLKGDGDRAMEIFNDINPIFHARNSREVQQYRTEPYVIAADVYSMPPHVGRGGWSWYTGSAAWTYRVALESILGITLRDGKLSFRPCVPHDWERFEVSFRVGKSTWNFVVELTGDSDEAADRLPQDAAASDPIELIDDGQEHHRVIQIPKQTALSVVSL